MPRLGAKVRLAPAWGLRDVVRLEAEARALERAGAVDEAAQRRAALDAWLGEEGKTTTNGGHRAAR